MVAGSVVAGTQHPGRGGAGRGPAGPLCDTAAGRSHLPFLASMRRSEAAPSPDPTPSDTQDTQPPPSVLALGSGRRGRCEELSWYGHPREGVLPAAVAMGTAVGSAILGRSPQRRPDPHPWVSGSGPLHPSGRRASCLSWAAGTLKRWSALSRHRCERQEGVGFPPPVVREAGARLQEAPSGGRRRFPGASRTGSEGGGHRSPRPAPREEDLTPTRAREPR